MRKIYTSYFGNIKNIDLREYQPISIALGNPNYINVPKIKELAPDWWLLKKFRDGEIDEEEYIYYFNKKLSKLNPKEIYDKIIELAQGKKPVLMCFCGRQHFCHRHLVADWLERELGIKVEEIGAEGYKRVKGRLKKQNEQKTLF